MSHVQAGREASRSKRLARDYVPTRHGPRNCRAMVAQYTVPCFITGEQQRSNLEAAQTQTQTRMERSAHPRTGHCVREQLMSRFQTIISSRVKVLRESGCMRLSEFVSKRDEARRIVGRFISVLCGRHRDAQEYSAQETSDCRGRLRRIINMMLSQLATASLLPCCQALGGGQPCARIPPSMSP